MTPLQAVKALMKFNDLTQADIGRIIGSESAVSMFLSGERELSKSQIKKLAAHFHVDAATFMS
jgi:HTH-type transcriptional regulator/antitoxin HigA